MAARLSRDAFGSHEDEVVHLPCWERRMDALTKSAGLTGASEGLQSPPRHPKVILRAPGPIGVALELEKLTPAIAAMLLLVMACMLF